MGEGERAALGEVAAQADLTAAAFADRSALAAAARGLAAAARAEMRKAAGEAPRGPGAAEAERALREALGGLAAGNDAPWARALGAALAGGGAVSGGTGRATRARAGDAARACTLAGDPADGTLRLLLAAGLLGPYLAATEDGEAAGRAAARARALAASGAAEVAAAILCEGGPSGPGHWPVWTAVLGQESDEIGDGPLAARAWSAFLACADTGDDALRAACADRGLLRCREGGAELGMLARRLPARWRADALAGRLAPYRWPGAEDEISLALAAGLPGWGRRRAALRAVVANPGTGDHDLGLCEESLTGRPPRAGVSGRAGAEAAGASRVRCARLLANLPIPAWRMALRLAGPGVAGAAGVWRLIAAGADDLRAGKAAWLLEQHGEEGDVAAIRAAMGQPRRHDAALECDAKGLARTLARGGTAMQRAAAAGLLDACRHHPAAGMAVLGMVGASAPEAAIPAAAGLLARGADAPRAARWLVRQAPEWASARALAAGGFLPGGEDGAAGRRAHRALARAWKETLDPAGAGD